MVLEVTVVPDVKCFVDSCEYHGRGDKCLAREIMVEADEGVGRGSSGWDQEVGFVDGEMEPASSPETCCGTFKKKG